VMLSSRCRPHPFLVLLFLFLPADLHSV
jgi:hypothetical protein